MRVICSLLVLLVLAACGEDDQQQAIPPELKTIESVDTPSLPVQPPPTLAEIESPIRTTTAPPGAPPTTTTTAATGTAAPQGGDQLQQKMDLPFAPAIAMDPVDGGKVSITPQTPVTEYKKKLYFFNSEANKRTFIASPDQFLKGQLATY